MDTALLRAEIDDLKRSKKEREEQMLSLRKTIVETQNELLKASKLIGYSPISDVQVTYLLYILITDRSMQEAGTNSVAAVAAKDAELRLAQTNNTVRLLEERLKEHEVTEIVSYSTYKPLSTAIVYQPIGYFLLREPPLVPINRGNH